MDAKYEDHIKKQHHGKMKKKKKDTHRGDNCDS